MNSPDSPADPTAMDANAADPTADVSPVVLGTESSRAEIYPQFGGRIGQITLGGADRLRGAEHRGAGWVSWGSYPLVPWSNRLPDGRFVLPDGSIGQVAINHTDGTAMHGLGAEVAWTVTAADDRSLTCEAELADGPYHVRATQTFSLDEDGLDQTLAVTNLASVSVPAGLGIHPWFAVGPIALPAESEWPGDDAMDPMPKGDPQPVTADSDLRAARVAPPMDRCYTGLTGSTATIGDLTLSWTGPITQIVVYSGDPDWVCVEPVTMSNDGIAFRANGNPDTGVVDLAPGDSLAVGYRFSIGDAVVADDDLDDLDGGQRDEADD